MRRTQWSLLMVLFSVPALGQTDATYLLLSSNTVRPSSPTTTIEIWAEWVDPGALYAFVGADYDLTAGDGVFSNPVNVLGGPASSTGVIAGNLISGASNGQIPWTTPFPWVPIRDNPILLATYDWTTTDFTPRMVDLHTSSTSAFIVGLIATGLTFQLYPQEFTPGSGAINVVPAPAAWIVLALPLAAATRRRRS